MGYNTQTFETAAQSLGYVIEKIKKNSLDTVAQCLELLSKGPWLNK